MADAEGQIRSADDRAETMEQSQESAEPAVKVGRDDLAAVQKTALRLIEQLGKLPNGDLVGEIIDTSLKLLRDQVNRGDTKLVNKSMKELRYALKVFGPYHDVRKVSIFGSARTDESQEDYRQAAAFGRAMADAGWMVMTGAGGGIMAAGHGGAGAEPSFGLAIRLPFEQKTNVYIAKDPKLISFKYFFTRKLMFVRSSHAVALFPGGFGTMDEGFEVLTLIQTGKSVPMPIVMVDTPGGDYWAMWDRYVRQQLLGRKLINEDDLRLYRITTSVGQAVREVRHFYNNYHSLRYTRQDVVIRLQRRPGDQQIEQIEKQFAGINISGRFRVSGPLPVERDEPSLAGLHRLVFRFNRRDHGRLRMLIDHLNDLP
jgi:hypothetical protein